MPPASPARKSLQHRTISSAVAEELRRRIVDGEFQSGFQLRQDALAAEFGVSRIPVREALMQLEAEGLVKIHPHRGAIVSELSTEEIEELFELRALLERAPLDRPLHRLEGLVQVERLGEVVEGAALDGADGGREIAEGSDDDDRGVLRELAEAAERAQAVHAATQTHANEGFAWALSGGCLARSRQ